VSNVVCGDFEWDEGKARQNLRAHGISFAEATSVFDDPLAVTERSRRHSVTEDRYVIIGQSEEGRLMAVAYAVRGRLRIISARKLTPKNDVNMKTKRKHSGKRTGETHAHDPLAEELDFKNDLEIVGWGPGWSQVPKRLRSPKHLKEARAWLKRKNATPKSPRRAA
jgi:uncharacterized DUF497 family protein